MGVDVGASSRVVGQIPAVVVEIVVDNDGIAVPVPVIGVVVIVGSYAEVEAAEPKALAVPSAQMVLMAAAKAAGEAAVFPGMIEMIVRVAATGIMADPSAIVVDVRRIRMTLPIAEGAGVFLPMTLRVIFGCAIVRGVRRSASHGRRAVRGHVTVANIASSAAALLSFALSTSGTGQQERRDAKSE